MVRSYRCLAKLGLLHTASCLPYAMLQQLQLFLPVWSAMLSSASGGSLWDGVLPGHIVFRQHGLCASGQPSYYGVIQPEKLLSNDALFVELMGGAICFNHASCANRELRLWTDIDEFLKGFVKLGENEIAFFKSGSNVPLSALASIRAGYMPTSPEHPGYGKRAIFMPMCTADIFVGKHNATYDPKVLTDARACDETKTGSAAQDYKGCQNWTLSGLPCQKWSIKGARFGLGDHNYCRNPDGESTIWCYTENSNVRWDYCKSVIEVPSTKTLYHHGGSSFSTLLTAVKKELPDLKEVQLYGASGGGVAAAAWASLVADMWTEAKVRALADSSMHVFPGTQLFDYFWEKAKYGPGPAGKATPQYDVLVPDFDWRQQDALAKHLTSHEGRVKLAYMSCIDDYVVYGDRRTMAAFAGLNDEMDALLNKSTQHERTWAFLRSLHSCSPQATVFSYILNCDRHHFTRNAWSTPLMNPGTNVTIKSFARRFLQGLYPDEHSQTTQFWYEGHTANSEGTPSCPSAVRRRRGVSATPEQKQESAKEEGVDHGSKMSEISGFLLILLCGWLTDQS